MNRKHTIYFELFDKRMKTSIQAESEKEAIEKLKNKIIIRKIAKSEDEFNQAMDLMDNIIDSVKSKDKRWL